MSSTQLNQVYFNPKQLKLPLSTDILIPFDSEARTFDEVFRRIEVEKYLVTDKDPRGRTGYNPVNMLKLVLFCQMEKIQSLREMEKAAKNDIRIMWLTDELKPSHQTIKTFMDVYLTTGIEEIFYEINQFLIKEEQIDTTKLYIDGTKIESRAHKYSFVWRGSVEKAQIKLQNKITKEIEKLNKEYETEGINFPIYETYEVTYLNKIRVFLEREIELKKIEFKQGKGSRKPVLQRHYEKIFEYETKQIEYEKHLEIMGSNRNSYAKTDKDATFMHMKEDHMRNSQLKPGYNIQIGVADEYILHMDISSERSDYKTFIPFLERYYKAYKEYPIYPVADSGYGGLMNYRYLKEKNLELYTKYSMYHKDTHDKKRMNDPYIGINLKKDSEDNFIDITGNKFKHLWRNKRGNDVYYIPDKNKNIEVNEELIAYQKEVIKNLSTDLGIELRIQRSIQVEGTFGVIKEAFKLRRFKRCGTEKVRLEFLLVAIGYNLSKFHNKRYRLLN